MQVRNVIDPEDQHMHIQTTTPGELRTFPMEGLMVTCKPIRVFVISDFQLFIDALNRAITGRPDRFVLLGVAPVLTPEAPWNGSETDVVVLDMDQDPDAALDWLAHHHGHSRPRWVLVSRNHLNGLAPGMGIPGGCGVLGRHHSLEQTLQAIEQVHEGNGAEAPNAVVTAHQNCEADQGVTDLAPVVRLLLTLTGKERRILSSLLRSGGAPAKVIADKMFISESTLRSHLTSIYLKMGVRNRIELVSQAARSGLANHLSSLETMNVRREQNALPYTLGNARAH